MKLRPAAVRIVPWCLALACGLLAAPTQAQDADGLPPGGGEVTPAPEGVEALLEVCDLLGWSDVAGKEPVELRELLGYTEPIPAEKREFRGDWGWVLAETDGVIDLLDGAGTRRTVRRSAEPVRGREAVVRPITVEVAAERVLQPPEREWMQSFDSPELADRWCARVIGAAQFRRAGRDDLAERLLASLEPWNERAPLAVARDQLAMRVLWRVVVDFRRSGVPRSDLLRRLRVWDRFFRGTEHAPMAADLLREMERMVAEDEQRASRPAATGGRTRVEQIADLIWRLRDSDWGARVQTGPDEWRDVGDEISAFGWDAVPMLIEALGDTRTTRCVTEWRYFHFPGHHVLRIGDCALDVLLEITGQDFRQRGVVARCGTPEWDDVRTRAVSWWKERGPNGEAASLANDLRTLGGWQRSRAFRRFVEVAPAEALDFAKARLRDAITHLDRLEALADIGLCPGPDGTAILREQLRSERSIDARTKVALALHARGEPGMKPVLLALWEEAAAWDQTPDEDTFRALILELTRLDAESRAAVVAETRRHPIRTADTVAHLWRMEFRSRKTPALEGVARDYVADLTLEVLSVPPLADLTRPPDAGKPGREYWWSRSAALAVLARLRGVKLDPMAGPVSRLRAIESLVSGERADRKLESSPDARRRSEPTLVEQVPLAPGDAARSVTAVWLAAGNPVAPDDAALAPLRALLGKPLDAPAVEAAVRGAFRARPKGSSGVVLRLMRGNGPIVAEAYFDDVAGTRGLELRLGHGEGFNESISSHRIGGPGMADGEFDDWIRTRVAASLERAAAGDWILDVRMAVE